jgi:dTDP-4-amino-4,6-dideoxygalactose transaminase
MYAHGKGTCPNAHAASEEVITLPIHLKLTDEDCRKVVEVLMAGVKRR